MSVYTSKTEYFHVSSILHLVSILDVNWRIVSRTCLHWLWKMWNGWPMKQLRKHMQTSLHLENTVYPRTDSSHLFNLNPLSVVYTEPVSPCWHLWGSHLPVGRTCWSCAFCRLGGSRVHTSPITNSAAGSLATLPLWTHLVFKMASSDHTLTQEVHMGV